MEFTKHPLDPHTWPRDITPLGEKGEAGYLKTFPNMPGCVVIGDDSGDAFSKEIEKAEKWLRYTHKLETILSIKMGDPDFRLPRLFYCPDPDWGE